MEQSCEFVINGMLNNEMIHFQGLKAYDRVTGAYGRGEVPSDAEMGGQAQGVAGIL